MEATAELILDTLPANIDQDANIAVEVSPTERRVKIMLEESDTIPPGGQFFGVQGKGFKLRAGVEAEVPESIINILDSAVMSVPILDEGNRVTGYRDKLRFPYRVITTTRKAS